jgi:hypothetical protein
MNPAFHLYCVANNEAILERDLKASPDIAGGVLPLTVLLHQESASGAYARAFTDASADYLVFAHQDVYLPRGWLATVAARIAALNERHPDWAVLGLFGATPHGQLAGHLWDAALGLVGGHLERPAIRAVSLDEVVLIVRRDAGIAFDAGLPSFHLYGTDLALAAKNRGLGAFIIDAPVIHNTRPIARLGRDYVAAYRYMVRKWRRYLPSPTVILPLAASPWPLRWRRSRVWWKGFARAHALGRPIADPAARAEALGFARALP